jgi:hypothetical protein
VAEFNFVVGNVAYNADSRFQSSHQDNGENHLLYRTFYGASNATEGTHVSDDSMSTDDEAADYRRLWSSVIIQALIDATSEPTRSGPKADKAQAVAWITASVGTTARDFEEVCLAANVPAERVRNFFKTYQGPPLTLHMLSRWRREAFKETSDAD